VTLLRQSLSLQAERSQQTAHWTNRIRECTLLEKSSSSPESENTRTGNFHKLVLRDRRHHCEHTACSAVDLFRLGVVAAWLN
jgi:hypothetical protein